MWKPSVLLAGAVALAMAGPLAAQVGSPGPDTPPLSKPPSDKPITPPSTSFQALDKNSDGNLSSAELGPSNPVGSMAALDQNGDGKISEMEYQKGGKPAKPMY